jgi:hypothetical protein
MKSDKSERK